MKRLEQVVYAYNGAGQVRMPSERALDEAIEWAFAIRLRKPRPCSGEWLIKERQPNAPVLSWAEVEGGFMRCSFWPEGCDVPWFSWCWKLLTEAGLTEFEDPRAKDLVILRAVVLQHIYWDFCLTAFDKMRRRSGERLYIALGGNRLEWDEHASMAQRFEVAGTILGHYKRFDEDRSNRGMLQFTGGAVQALFEDLEAALPLKGDTLKEHFSDPAMWADDSKFYDMGKQSMTRFEKKMKLIEGWLILGMKPLEVSQYNVK
ncbi:MAG: hypothetical protein WAT41_09340 [Flavobacteriales bacterium]